MTIKKGDICAIIETHVTHFAFGSGREPTKRHNIRIVRAESATRDGLLKKYRAYPASPVYSYSNRYGATKVMTIVGEPQAHAQRLFDKAAYFVDFDNQEAAKAAIMAA